MKHLFLPIVTVIAILNVSCEKNNDPVDINTGYSKGIYIINEGSYNSNNGSISFYDIKANLITNNIFEAVNNRPLGDIVQSFSVVGDTLGFVVVNNSSKIEIISLKTFKAITDPLQVIYPRYFMQVSSVKGYLSSGSYQGYLLIIDLNTFSTTDSIRVGYGPENMIRLDEKLYVANSGGWASDSTISVIDIQGDLVEDTLFTAQCPVDMADDSDGNLWVYCKGYTNYTNIETEACLQKIDLNTGVILWQSAIGMALDYSSTPAKFTVSKNKSKLFYIRPDGIYQIETGSPALQNAPLIPGNFYGVDVNPADGNIYVMESAFSGNGTLKIFSETGSLLSEGIVGIGPNGAVFNY